MKHQIIKYLPTRLYLSLRWHDFRLNRRNSFNKVQGLRLVDTEDSGGYLPFDRAKAIFVHIPKCAGISVNKALFKSIGGGHTTLDQYINVFEPSAFQSYFKFTFVRNPWDRVVSAYCFLQKGGLNKWDKAFFDRELAQFSSFEDFVKTWLCTDNLSKHHHFRPQHHYFIDKYRKVTVDYIGYFENIADDFADVASKIVGASALTKSNAVERIDYRDFYSEETKSIVASVYEQDIALLNYSFDGVNTPVRKIRLP